MCPICGQKLRETAMNLETVKHGGEAKRAHASCARQVREGGYA